MKERDMVAQALQGIQEATHSNHLDLQRHALAVEVYEHILGATESFEEQNIGADLAYLLGAILKGSEVEWDSESPPALNGVLSEGFEFAHPVWEYVTWTEED